jgi:tripartite-type tricarboxylate transporter receptor subunit TctC
MLKKFTRSVALVIALVAIAQSALSAETYNLILPNPPGSSSDIVARTISEEYNRQTGNTLILDYAPGGEHLVAVNKFKNQSRLTVILGTTTMHVFNHVTKPNLPYGDKEFTHIGWIGWSPQIWYVKADSKFKTIEDVQATLKSGKNINAAVDGLSTQANVLSVQKFNPDGKNMTLVRYKGSPQAFNDILGGFVDIANASVSSLILEGAKAGKIRILGTTTKFPVTLAGNTIPRAEPILLSPQFNGGFLISVSSSQANTVEGKKLRADVLKVINSEYVSNKLATINITVDGKGKQYVEKLLVNYRKDVNSILGK